MNIHLYSKWGELPVAGNYPGSPPGLLLPGAQLIIANNPSNTYCYIFQEFDTPAVTIRFCNLFSKEKDHLTLVTEPAIAFRMAVYRSHRFIPEHLGQQQFHQRQYNLFFTPHASVAYPFNAGDIFIYLDLILKKEYCRVLGSRFPALDEFFKKAAVQSAARYYLHNPVASIEVIRCYEQLEEWAFQPEKKRHTGESIAQNLVVQSLRSPHPEISTRPVQLSQEEIDLIYEIAEMICESSKNFTINELAGKIGMSAYKLDRGFKQIFGYSILKHRFEEKMLLALQIVHDERINSKQAARLLGYSDLESFTRAFRKRFGYMPFPSRLS